MKTSARVECLFTKRGELIAALIIQFSEDIYLKGTSQSKEDFCQIQNITSLTHTNITSLSYVRILRTLTIPSLEWACIFYNLVICCRYQILEFLMLTSI